MNDSSFSNHFDSYKNRSKEWVRRVEETGNKTPGFDESNESFENSGLNRLVSAHHPDLYNALLDECRFRNVEMPACYINIWSNKVTAGAYLGDHCISVSSKTLQVLDADELRALVAHELRHLYQDLPTDRQGYDAVEFECDRAAIESTDYDTFRSMMDKVFFCNVLLQLPITPIHTPLRLMQEKFPGCITEKLDIRFNDKHPSFAERLRAAREYAQELEDKENGWVR